MYSAPYGYGNAAGQAFNGAPPGQSPQMQPGPGQNQPQQQMMYNQQFSMGPSVSGGYAGAHNPGAMMPGGGAGPAGMMQNTAMPQMPANGQMNFHTPYTSSPYGAGVPSTSGPQGQFNPNYMMGGPMGGYPMNQQQQLIQRMQQQQQQQSQQASGGMGTPTPPRQFPGSQGTPNPTVPAQQGQFGTPSNPQAAAQSQTPTQAPPSANSVTTPQTPTFPMTGQGAVNGNSTPLSPNSQAKGQERISLLLEINQELLFEAINLRHNLEEVKREAASSAAPEQQKERKEEEEAFAHDWAQRLQANLAYLASLADRKQSSQHAPAYLTPPPLTLRLKLRPMAATPDAEKVDGSADREEREKLMREQYQKLQTLFPGIDPNNVPVSRPQMKPGAANPAMAMQNAQRMGSLGSIPIPQSPASSAHHGTPQMSNAATPTNQANSA
ncbi:hypothetical protein J7T55_004756 [Diaporthe amygdali]|uniref:uncharacterized protein n=1 Tax=Phomopsis amygdali TaxID=1214568 RepID=UPI0022FDDDE9|nr:uncharacterized protein J7T55_004756 [Diaporthe amygdali]KAJ0114513.1 hypothetical protein J7T55_004756 [Diaporthe amygdali]